MRQTHWCKMQKAPYLKLRDLRLNDVIFLRFEAPWQMNISFLESKTMNVT